MAIEAQTAARQKRQTLSALVVLLVGFGVLGPAQAQEEVEYKNVIELFVGAVTETEESATGPGVGLEYQRRLTRKWSVGVQGAEVSTTSVERGWLAVVTAIVKPVGGLALKTGPGFERSEETSEETGEKESKTEFAWRFGAAWEFELGRRYTLSPELNLDLVDGSSVWVYGLSFGIGC